MQKEKALEIIEELINNGEEVLKTKHNNYGEITGTMTFVDDTKFGIWKEQIKLFLSSEPNFKDSLDSFNQKFSMRTNFRYTEQYLNILRALKDSITKDIIELSEKSHDNKTCKSIFVGHGHNPLWAQVVNFLRDNLGCNDVIYFEKESRSGKHIGDILKGFANDTKFAVILMTAEDETKEDKIRARQNVIHEIGFFQGKLGFEKVAILKEDKVEPFSNIDGFQYIEFSGNNIKQTFFELQEMLKRENII